jgi:hypothetical protein
MHRRSRRQRSQLGIGLKKYLGKTRRHGEVRLA